MPDVSEKASFCPTRKREKKKFVSQPKVVYVACGNIGLHVGTMTTPRAVIHTYTQRQRKVRTHHLGELDGRVAHFIPNPDRDLNSQTKAKKKHKVVSNSSRQK